MPGSYSRFDDEIARLLRHAFHDKGAWILDIGAGSGKYAGLLSDYPNKEALEIHAPNVQAFSLSLKYRRVWVDDARTAIPRAGTARYDLVILGDVLEHMSVEDARAVLERIESDGSAMLVCVPYCFEQGALDGNEHEVHLQDDLTPDLMIERYPMLERILGDEGYGVYANRALLARMRGQGDSVATETRVEIDPSDFKHVRLAICTPNPGNVCTPYLISMIQTTQSLGRYGIEFRLFLRSGASIDRARNLIVKDVLDAGFRPTHVLWIDSDQGWDPSFIYRLLWHDKPMVGVASIKKMGMPGFAVHLGEDPNRIEYEKGLLKVSGVGTGFLLVRREVFLDLMKAHPELQVKDVPEIAGERHPKHYYTLYQTVLDEHGRYVGEDLTFCNRYRAIGGEVFVDPYPDLVHVGAKEFRGSLATHMTAVPEEGNQ